MNSSNPRVTIVIPTYQRPRYLPLAIESAVWQPEASREILVVSDADPGARAIAEQFPGVRYIELEEHGDLAGCMNRGIAEARGEYLMMLQDDDLALPCKATALADWLDEHREYAAVCSLSEAIDGDGAPHKESAKRLARYRRWGLAGITREKMVEVNIIDQPTVLYRTGALRAVGGFEDGRDYAEEMELHMRMLDLGYRFGFADVVTAKYRVHGCSKTLQRTVANQEDSNGVRDFYRRKWGAAEERGREPVIASLCTMFERAGSLRKTVASLLPQVDRLNVYLHGYPRKPPWLWGKKINVMENGPDRNVADKFFWAPDLPPCYHLVCDDDLIYPADYAATLVAKVEEYGRKRVISCHGARFEHFPIASYYRDRTNFSYRGPVDGDVPVHVGGTGVLAYHTSTVRFSPDDCHSPLCADLWFSIACQRQGVGITVIAHPENWIRFNYGRVNQKRTVYHWRKNDDALETAVVNGREWTLL